MPIPSGGGWDVPCEGNLLGMPIPSMSEGVPCEGGDMGWGCIMPIPCGGGWDMPCEGGGMPYEGSFLGMPIPSGGGWFVAGLGLLTSTGPTFKSSAR